MRRGRLIFVLGGASSGKTEAALKLAGTARAGDRPHAYVATARAGDREMAEKIRRHRRARGPGWATAEVPMDLVAWFEKDAAGRRAIVVDCLTLWLTNLLALDLPGEGILGRGREVVRAARRTGARVVIVSNEVGLGLVPADPESRAFRDLAGQMHQLVAGEADEVHLIVSGVPIKIK